MRMLQPLVLSKSLLPLSSRYTRGGEWGAKEVKRTDSTREREREECIPCKSFMKREKRKRERERVRELVCCFLDN